MELEEAICKSYLVNGLSEDEIDAIIAIAHPRAYSGGATLIRQFERNTDLMLLLEGAARINTFSGDQIVEMGAGSLIGEVSLLDDEPRSATVMSVGNTKVAVIPSEDLRALMAAYPNIELTILRNLSKVLCKHVRHANLQLETMRHEK